MTSGVNGGGMSPSLISDSFPNLGLNQCALICLVTRWGNLGPASSRRSYPGANCPSCLMIRNKWYILLVDSLTLFLIVPVSILFLIYQVVVKWAFQNPDLLWDLGSLKARSQPWALLALWVNLDWNFWTSVQAILHLRGWVLPCCYHRSLQSASLMVNMTIATHSKLNPSSFSACANSCFSHH